MRLPYPLLVGVQVEINRGGSLGMAEYFRDGLQVAPAL
jgi:hypothetical protein